MKRSASLRVVFRGERGVLLAAMLLTEFAVSVDKLGYSTVIPVAAHDLEGEHLHSAALTAAQVVHIACMAFGAALYGRVGAAAQLWIATLVWLLGATMSVAAPDMVWLVAGMAIRGIAGGLIAGLGIGVLSGLYSDAAERERAFGLFAAMWVIPSLVAPAINAALLAGIGWRWTLAWPIALLLIGRAFVGSRLSLVSKPQASESRALAAFPITCIALALGVAQWAIASHAAAGIIGAAACIAIALTVLRRAFSTLTRGTVRAQQHCWIMALAAATCFGTAALLPLLAVRYVDNSGAFGAIVVAACPLAWTTLSSSGITTSWRAVTAARFAGCMSGASMLATASWLVLATENVVLGTIVLGAAACCTGLAMGATYPRLLSGAFTGFSERGGSTRAHLAIALDLAEITGAVAGATVLAGIVAALLTHSLVLGAATIAALAITVLAAWIRASAILDTARSLRRTSGSHGRCKG